MTLMQNFRNQSESTKGTYAGAAVYLFWGSVVLYWPMLEPATAIEILCNRVLWSLLTLLIIVALQKRTHAVIDILRKKREVFLLLLASILIAANWGLFIWANLNGHILDSSLGYFVTPLLSVLLGVFFFQEKLRSLQWVAIAVSSCSLVVFSLSLSGPPWLALSIGATFAAYGYVKKLAQVPAVESLTVETILLTPFAAVYLVLLSLQGNNTFSSYGISHSLWLASAGIITSLPLLLFGFAAIRVPLSRLGMLQYLSPTISFIFGLFVFNETMSAERLAGFVITWLALAILSYDVIRQRERKVTN
ncbi:MAG: EamA family transporter RarD [Actinomycetota bacterium]|jgi:chloramphenicol-sensitive protein RarD